MIKGMVFVFFILLSTSAFSDGFRCGNALVKDGDSINMLLKKCGDPIRKYSANVDINDHGRRYSTSVTNWVYERSGKKDMIVSVRNGEIIKIQRD